MNFLVSVFLIADMSQHRYCTALRKNDESGVIMFSSAGFIPAFFILHLLKGRFLLR